MKEIITKVAVRLFIALAILYPVAYVAASNGYLGEAEIGYYRGLYVAKHAIEKSGCVEGLERSHMNEDVFLEEFGYTVTTKSGKTVELGFDASSMNVYQVCYKPVGVAVYSTKLGRDWQAYKIDLLNGLLRERGIQVKRLQDVLCNIDELADLFEANYANADIPRGSYPNSWDYLMIEIDDNKQ